MNTLRNGRGTPRKMGEYRSCLDRNWRKCARSSLKSRSTSSRYSSCPPAGLLDMVVASATGTTPSAGAAWAAGASRTGAGGGAPPVRSSTSAERSGLGGGGASALN